MTQELLYTSAPRGLKPGSSGFCTVASTRGMAAPLAAALESLSAYRHVFRPGDPQSHRNPVAYSHVKLNAGGRAYSVLSRVADYGQDYSGRTNKLAHHIALQTSEIPAGGPASLLAQPQFMESDWDGEPRILPVGRPAKQSRPTTLGICRNWQDMTGDAGWAGVLAEAYLNDSQRAVYIVVEPGMDLLPLFSEAIGLLPENRRWDVTFSTYFTTLPRSVTCLWRCVLAGSKEANESRRFVQALRIDLTAPLERATGGAFVEQARTGQRARPTAPPVPQAAVAADTNDVEYFEVVESGELEPTIPSAANRTVGTYGVTGSSTAPPPPPRRRRDFDTDESETSGRKTKLVVMVTMLLMMVGTIAGIVVHLQSGNQQPADEAVVKADGPKDDAKEPKPKQAGTDAAKPIDIPTTSKNTGGKVAAMAGAGQPTDSQASTTGQKKNENGKDDGAGNAVKKNASEGESVAASDPATNDNKGDARNGDSVPKKDGINGVVPESEKTQEPYRILKLPGTLDVAVKTGNDKRFRVAQLKLSGGNQKLTLFMPTFFTAWSSKSGSDSIDIKHASGDLRIAEFLIERDQLDNELHNLILNMPERSYTQEKWTFLKWCVLQLEDGSIKHRFVFQKPITSIKNNRFDDGRLAWDFALAQDIEGTEISALRIGHVTLLIDSIPITFTPRDNDPYELTCDGLGGFFDDVFVETFNKQQLKKLKHKPLIVRCDVDRKRQFVVTLSKLHTQKSSEFVNSHFTFHAKTELAKRRLDYNAKECGIEDFVSPTGWVIATLGSLSKELLEMKDKKKDSDLIQQKQEKHDVVTKLQSIARMIDKRYSALENAKITAAHIYYEVKTGDKQPLQIDVIKFGDPPQQDEDQKPQPAGKPRF